MLAFALSRKRILVAGLVLAALGALAVHPTWARSIGADVWNLPTLKEEIRTSTKVEADLNGESQEVQRRLKVKETIIIDLINSRITLAEATECFTELNSSRPEYMVVIRDRYPGKSELEVAARNVIDFALPRAEPQTRDALEHRLETELRQMMAGSAGQ